MQRAYFIGFVRNAQPNALAGFARTPNWSYVCTLALTTPRRFGHSAKVQPGLARATAMCLLGVWLECSGCGSSRENGVLGTVDLGDDFVAPDLQLDSAFFFCRIQPEVLTKYSCASGGSGEMGSCHDSHSAMRLIATKVPAPCDKGGTVIDAVPDAYQMNLDAVRFSVQSDPLSSPLYLRPLNRASHPRKIFDDNDKAAKLIVEWISGATP